jgi:hypothetical protein
MTMSGGRERRARRPPRASTAARDNRLISCSGRNARANGSAIPTFDVAIGEKTCNPSTTVASTSEPARPLGRRGHDDRAGGHHMSGDRLTRVLTFIALIALVASCSSSQPSSPSPTPGPPLTAAQLKIRLIEQLGPLWYCDPDFYPIPRDDEADLARQRFGEVQADGEAFDAITVHLGVVGPISDDQKLAIYRLWKQLRAIVLDAAADGTFRFDYLNMPPAGAAEGRRTAGTIDAHGTLTIEQQAGAGEPPCPICLARGTRIATPDGEIPIEDVRVGMSVWSIGGTGKRFVARVVLVGRTPVPASHEVVRLVLSDGQVVRASPGHPLADGRPIGSIQGGDRVDGAVVVSAALEPYDGGFTFDLLPDGPTGIYLADGVALRSTLR